MDDINRRDFSEKVWAGHAGFNGVICGVAGQSSGCCRSATNPRGSTGRFVRSFRSRGSRIQGSGEARDHGVRLEEPSGGGRGPS